MRVLAIETSCDETSAAVVESRGRVLSNVVASQVDLHAQWGGVVPEAAAREHVERITPVISQALQDAATTYDHIQGIAVTNRPGLVGALVVGVTAAKALHVALGLPMIGVHHLEGHIFSARLAKPDIGEPFLCLIVSGGHTELVTVNGFQYQVIGETLDDAAGEAFDKGARLLGLGYPGGLHVDRVAKQGDPKAIAFPRSFPGDGYDFSFSGLKTSVLRYVEKTGPSLNVADTAASMQQAIVDALVERTAQAADALGFHTVAVVGGVAANSVLRRDITARLSTIGREVVIAPLEYCTDNAAMIGAAGLARLELGQRDDLTLDAFASAPLPET